MVEMIANSIKSIKSDDVVTNEASEVNTTEQQENSKENKKWKHSKYVSNINMNNNNNFNKKAELTHTHSRLQYNTVQHIAYSLFQIEMALDFVCLSIYVCMSVCVPTYQHVHVWVLE